MEQSTAEPVTPDPRRARVVARVLWVLAFALLLAAAAQHAHHAWRVILFPYDLDNGEGFLLNQSAMIARGDSPWTPIDEEPYLVSNFAPLYQTLLALPVRLGSLSFAWGRSLSALATLTSAILVFLIVRRVYGAAPAAALAALLFLAAQFVYDWTALHRVDALALAFSLGGLHVVSRGGRAVTAGALFGLALLTRQTSVFAAAAATTWLFSCGRRGDAARVCAVGFGVPIAAYLVLGALTQGEFLRHAFLYNVQPWSLSLLGTFLAYWVWYHPGVLALGIVAVAWQISERKPSLSSTYLAFAAATLVMAGRAGAASNYMLDLVAALALSIGGVLARASRSAAAGDRGLEQAVLATLCVQALVSQLAFRSLDVLPTPDDDDARRARDLGALVARANGEVLSEDAGWLLLGGKPVTFEPYMMSRLAADGVWDPAPIVRKISAREYALVLLNFDVEEERSIRFDAAISESIRANYRHFRRIPGPGGSDRSPSPNFNWHLYVPHGPRP